MLGLQGPAAEKTGSSFNWKKTGLSRAYYRHRPMNVKDMTQRAAAAFQFLQKNNKYYEYFLKEHNRRLDSNSILTISSFELFIKSNGIEAATRP